jgi:hypothetical protein
MGRFGERDTRFKGAQEMPERTDKVSYPDDAGQSVHFHNWTDLVFNARTYLAELGKHLSDKN